MGLDKRTCANTLAQDVTNISRRSRWNACAKTDSLPATLSLSTGWMMPGIFNLFYNHADPAQRAHPAQHTRKEHDLGDDGR